MSKTISDKKLHKVLNEVGLPELVKKIDVKFENANDLMSSGQK